MENFSQTKRNFEFSSVGKTDLRSKFENDLILKNKLNTNLLLDKYGKEIQTLFFIYQAIEPNNPARIAKDFLRYRKSVKIMELYLTLDYYAFLDATQEEALQMMAKLYLKGIEMFLFKRKDFDGKKFYDDVKNLFLREKFIPQE